MKDAPIYISRSSNLGLISKYTILTRMSVMTMIYMIRARVFASYLPARSTKLERAVTFLSEFPSEFPLN